jgi:hypothetical protein
MNWQQSYPGVWLGPVVPRTPVKADDDDEFDAEAEWIEEREREAEMAIDEARNREES